MRIFLKAAALGATGGATATATDVPATRLFPSLPDRPIIPARWDSALWPAFRKALCRLARSRPTRDEDDDALYRRPEFAWAAPSFCLAFVMMCDERIYDRRTGRYTVDAFLDHGLPSLAGSIVWCSGMPTHASAYDQRNQFTFTATCQVG